MFNPQHLSTTFNALAKIGFYSNSLVSCLCTASRRPDVLSSFNGHAIANILNSLAVLSHLDRGLVTALCGAFLTRLSSSDGKNRGDTTPEPQQLANCLHACVVLGHFDRQWFEAMLRHVEAIRIEDWSGEALSQLYLVNLSLDVECKQWGLRLPDRVFTAASATDKRHKARVVSSNLHLQVSAALTRLGLPHVNEGDKGGLSVDIVLGERESDEEGWGGVVERKKVVIEVDGPRHFLTGGDAGSKRTHGFFHKKQRLLEKQGFTVLHVPFFEWNEVQVWHPGVDKEKAQEMYLEELLQS